MVSCQPFAELPWPNLATNGRVKPPTMSCATMAATNRYEESVVRSFTSPVMTPVSAEYGVLLAEYSVISRMFVMQAQMSLPLMEKSGVV